VKSSLLLLLASLLLPAAARSACVVDNQATVALNIVGGTITVPVAINGTVATMILDTGAQRSILTEVAAHRLNVARDEWVGTTMRGIGGVVSRPNADPRTLTLGGIPLVRRTLSHDTSLTVGIIPRTQIGDLVIDGALGRDFLSAFDLDLDVPDGRLTLYRVRGCSGRFLPWRGGYTGVPASLLDQDAVIVPVMLDGVPLRALLDTGASASLVAAPGLFRLGLQPGGFVKDPADQVSGVGAHVVTMHRHTFRSLQVGGQVTSAPVIWAAPGVHLTPIVDMLLGADWLGQRRVWISYATRQLFVAAP
jgi:hypothetical protein